MIEVPKYCSMGTRSPIPPPHPNPKPALALPLSAVFPGLLSYLWEGAGGGGLPSDIGDIFLSNIWRSEYYFCGFKYENLSIFAQRIFITKIQ